MSNSNMKIRYHDLKTKNTPRFPFGITNDKVRKSLTKGHNRDPNYLSSFPNVLTSNICSANSQRRERYETCSKFSCTKITPYKNVLFGSMEVWFMERRIKTPENDKNHSPIRDCKDRATHTSMNNWQDPRYIHGNYAQLGSQAENFDEWECDGELLSA